MRIAKQKNILLCCSVRVCQRYLSWLSQGWYQRSGCRSWRRTCLQDISCWCARSPCYSCVCVF